MKNHVSTAAGIPAAAGAARLHDGFGTCSYPWQTGTTASSISMHTNVVPADSKLRHRWPEEPSP